MRGAAIAWAPAPKGRVLVACPAGTWSANLLSRIAPTARDEESRTDPGKNPDFDYLLRGTVHDPTARRMGGVAGHAGVFSTAHDVSIYAQALLDRLAGRPSKFPLKQATLELMTTPQQPGPTAQQLEAANDAAREAIVKTPNTRNPLLAPDYPAIKGQNLRGFGWDIDIGHSKPRGMVFPIGSFGHTGFTGTMLWMDPGSDTYVILFANSIHLRGSPPISNLRGEVATASSPGAASLQQLIVGDDVHTCWPAMSSTVICVAGRVAGRVHRCIVGGWTSRGTCCSSTQLGGLVAGPLGLASTTSGKAQRTRSWPMAEGPADTPGLIDPVIQWGIGEASPSGLA